MNSSEPRIKDKKEENSVNQEENSVNQSKFSSSDLRQKENDSKIFNDSDMDSSSKCSHVTAVKTSQGFIQFRLSQSNCSQWTEQGHTGHVHRTLWKVNRK